MKIYRAVLRFIACFAAATALATEVQLPSLDIDGDVYTNVLVTSVTATDIYFQHSRGMGNAKLKNLSPELQKQFKFDPARAGEVEKQRVEGNVKWREELKVKSAKAAASKTTTRKAASKDEPEITVPKIHAKSFRGSRAPSVVVDEWVGEAAKVEGKFVLVDFWATWCGPCRSSIPHLNALQAKFRDNLVIIGLTQETPAEVRRMKSPQIKYAIGIDTKGSSARAAEVRGIPHAILVDPSGIVRFEGHPSYLNEEGLAAIIEKYGS